MDKKTEAQRERQNEQCRAYYNRRRQDPEKYQAFLEAKRLACREQYQKRAADPAKREQQNAVNRLRRRKKKSVFDKRDPSVAVITKHHPDYKQLGSLRRHAREHALTERLDLYAVYVEWHCVFVKDYPGMRNPLATKRKQTTRILEATI